MKEIRQTFSETNFKPAVKQQDFQEYRFKVTNQKKLIYLLVGIFFITSLLGAVFIYNRNSIDPLTSMPLLTLFFIGSFFAIRKPVSEQYVVQLSDAEMVINSLETTTIPFNDIISYKIERAGGIRLTLTLKSKGKIHLLVNGNFTRFKGMEAFVSAFDTKMIDLISANRISTIRNKGSMEKWYALPFLISLTCLGLIAVGTFIYNHKTIPIYLYSTFGLLIGLWYGYFVTRRKTKTNR